MSSFFSSDRLLFRSWNDSDRVVFREMNSDPDVLEFLHPPLSASQSDSFVDVIEDELQRMGWGLWAVETIEEGKFIGFIGFHQAQFEAPFTPCVEIGWRLKKEAWGRGYATEGARRCLKTGFDELNFQEVFSFTTASNVRSLKVMEKIGMKYSGSFDHPNVPEGDPLRPHLLYRITVGA